MLCMDFLFFGLGNPSAYRGTRHNIGKDLLEGLVSEEGGTWQHVAKGRISCLLLGPHVITCVVSDGFMNEVGSDMRGVLLAVDPSQMLVIHDDVDLPVGSVRLSRRSSSGGHRGVLSVINTLGTDAFFRLRVGVGRGDDLAQYVLEAVPPGDVRSIVAAVRAAFPDILLNRLLVS